jgi:hypothetical protein
LYLLIRLRLTEGVIQIHKHQFGYLQAHCPGEFSADKLGYEGFLALPCSTKFQDVEEIIVGLYNGRQRASFPQRLQVLYDIDGADFYLFHVRQDREKQHYTGAPINAGKQ